MKRFGGIHLNYINVMLTFDSLVKQSYMILFQTCSFTCKETNLMRKDLDRFGQTSRMKFFMKIVNHFRFKFHLRGLTWL